MLTTTSQGKYYNYPHFTGEEKRNHTMLSNLPKVTHLETGRTQNRTQAVWLQIPHT